MNPRILVPAGFLLAAVAGWWWLWLPRERPASAPPPSRVTAEAETTPQAAPQPLVVLPNMGKPRAPAVVSADDPRRELRTALPEFIRLARAQDYVALVGTFSPPDDLAKVTRAVSLPNLAEQMRGQPDVVQGFSELAAALDGLRDRSPQYDPAGETATYPLNPPINNKHTVTFVKVNGLWYLQN